MVSIVERSSVKSVAVKLSVVIFTTSCEQLMFSSDAGMRHPPRTFQVPVRS
jgi:hypothetical protein